MDERGIKYIRFTGKEIMKNLDAITLKINQLTKKC